MPDPVPGVVHLKSVMRDHAVLGSVVSGSRLELRERDVRRAHDLGYEVRDIPDDGRHHPRWPTQGPGGSNPCPVCTALAVSQVLAETRGNPVDDNGKLTGWTAFLIVAGIVLAIVGAAMAPDGQVYTWLLVGAWLVTNAAFNNVYQKVRSKVREREIREEERSRLPGFPQDRRSQR